MPIKNFLGLKSQMYTFITKDNDESKKAKYINKNVFEDELAHGDYKNYFSIDHIRVMK